MSITVSHWNDEVQRKKKYGRSFYA